MYFKEILKLKIFSLTPFCMLYDYNVTFCIFLSIPAHKTRPDSPLPTMQGAAIGIRNGEEP